MIMTNDMYMNMKCGLKIQEKKRYMLKAAVFHLHCSANTSSHFYMFILVSRGKRIAGDFEKKITHFVENILLKIVFVCL